MSQKPAPQEPDYSNEVYVRRTIAKILTIGVPVWLVATLIWVLVAEDDGHGGLLRVYLWGFFLFPAFIVMAYAMAWRCPHCSKFLGLNRKRTSCPRCGTELTLRRPQ